jgi:HEAT repeat protein
MPTRRALAVALALTTACAERDDASYRATIDLGPAVRSLASDDLDESEAARTQLTAVGTAALPVIEAALAREAAATRVALVEVVGDLPRTDGGPLLVALARDDPSEDVRYAALGALGASDDPQAVAVLTRALADGSPRIRLAAASACTRSCRSPEAVAGLVTIALRDPLRPNGMAARKALLRVCGDGDAECAAETRATVLAAVRPVITDGDDGAAVDTSAIRAALLAADQGDAAGAALLVRAAGRHDAEPLLRLGSVYALGTVGDARAVPALVELDDAPAVDAYAYDALRRLAERGVREAATALDGWSGPRPAAPLPPPLFG